MKVIVSLVCFTVSILGAFGQPTTDKKVSDFPGSFSFYVIGDWGRDGKHGQREVSTAMNQTTGVIAPKFIISTGDNFYPDGVKTTDDKQWKTSFEDIYNGAGLQCPWYVVLGNHDYHSNPQAEVEYTKNSKRWTMPARYFHKNIPMGSDPSLTIDFIFIDTSPLEDPYYSEEYKQGLLTQDTTRQLHWIDSLLKKSTARWKFVIGHHHVYTAGKRVSEVAYLRRHLERILIKNKVDIYFCGHEHSLQHIKPENGVTHYFVSGSGSEVTPTHKLPNTMFAASQSGFMIVSVSSDVIHIQAVNMHGEKIYATAIKK